MDLAVSARSIALAALIALLPCSMSAALEADPSAPVDFVRDGQTSWTIQIPQDSPRPVAWAAEELARYLREMSGCELRVTSGSTEGASGPLIRVGLRDHLTLPGDQQLPVKMDGHDGYATSVWPAGDVSRHPSITIAGDTPCGVIYGVYDLLEQLGCRWFYPTQDARDPEVVPQRTTLSLPASVRRMATPLQYRICNGSAWYFAMNTEAARAQLDWGMKNRYNGIGWQSESTHTLTEQYDQLVATGLIDELEKRGMFLHGPAHSFDHFLPSKDLMTSHPEWFGMRDGKRSPQNFFGAQFCWSNAEARTEFARNVESFVSKAPQIKILCLVPFDGGKACTCPECTRIGASNTLMQVMNDVIDRVHPKYPDLLFETVGGYEPVTEPPTDTKIHPLQRVIWAHWGRHHGMGYNNPEYARLKNLETWRQAVDNRITICQYYTDNFAEPWILPPFTTAMIGDREYFQETKITSVYMLMWSPGYWWNHSLNGYLAGRAFYNAALDPEAELDDYARRYYGEEAGALIGQYYRQWAGKVELAYRLRGTSNDEDRAMLADQRRQFIDPAVQAVAGDRLLSYRMSHVADLHRLAEALALVNGRRLEVERLRTANDKSAARSLLEKARPEAERTLQLCYELADRNCGLIDRNEIPLFMGRAVTGWIAEEEKALAAP